MLYFYGVREGAAPGGEFAGLVGEPISWLACDPEVGEGWVSAAGEMARRPDLSAATLAAHDHAARRVAAGSSAFLPARFGQLFADERALGAALRARQDSLGAALVRVRGCAQMTVRLFGPAPPPTPDALVGADLGPGPGARFLAGRRAAAAPPAEVAALRSLLGGLVVAERWQKSAAPGLIGTVAHLVPQGSLLAYRRALPAGAFGAAHSVRVSGPWLPYAFVPELGAAESS